MLLFYIAFLLLCTYGVRLVPEKNEFNRNYLSVETTQSVKGMFILLVFFSHFNSYVTYTTVTDLAYLKTVVWFGQTMVTLFLFYSGYGVMESIRRQGNEYIRSIPVRRVLATLFRFALAVLVFAMLDLVLGKPFTWQTFLLSLFGWESLGNSNWYIFVILVLYLFTYFSFSVFGKKGRYIPAASSVLFLSLLYLICFAKFDIKPAQWYNTVLCYSMGMFYSLLRQSAERIINRNRIFYCLTLGTLVVLSYFTEKYSTNSYVELFRMPIFAAAVVVATMRIRFGNRILQWCGKHLFELYILQRIPMILFAALGLEGHIRLYFCLCVFGTLLLIIPFARLSGFLWSALCGKKRNTAE